MPKSDIKKKSSGSWDADLRALAAASNEEKRTSPVRKRKKPVRPKTAKKPAKTKDVLNNTEMDALKIEEQLRDTPAKKLDKSDEGAKTATDSKVKFEFIFVKNRLHH